MEKILLGKTKLNLIFGDNLEEEKLIYIYKHYYNVNYYQIGKIGNDEFVIDLDRSLLFTEYLDLNLFTHTNMTKEIWKKVIKLYKKAYIINNAYMLFEFDIENKLLRDNLLKELETILNKIWTILIKWNNRRN